MKAIDREYIAPKGINQSFEIALQLSEYADADGEYERISELSVRFPCGVIGTYGFDIRNFYVTDPDGNREYEQKRKSGISRCQKIGWSGICLYGVRGADAKGAARTALKNMKQIFQAFIQKICSKH